MVEQVSDTRKKALSRWISQIKVGHTPLEMISGDASSRRYFRFHDQNCNYIAVDAPPEQEDVELFVALTEKYSQEGLNVPSVYHYDLEQGFMCLLDLGDELLSLHLNLENVIDFYRSALNLLPSIRNVQATRLGQLPHYDASMLSFEMNLMDEWFIKKLLMIQLNSAQKDQLSAVKQIIIDNVTSQSQVGVHRDFHSRNLMLYNNEIAVIDYQGAVIGPVTYDLVSLLRDCYVDWPCDVLDNLLKEQFIHLKQEGVLFEGTSEAEFIKGFDLMGMQRHIKVLGIFSRLSLRDQKHHYLEDIPRVLHYLIDVSSRYVEFKDFSIWLREEILPKWNHVCIAR